MPCVVSHFTTLAARRPESFFPSSLLAVLPSIEADLAGLARIHAVHSGADGSERLLVALADGQTVESVLLPRDGLCVSSQVGCAVGCQFCMTGREGLLRQVESAEIVAQVALARGIEIDVAAFERICQVVAFVEHALGGVGMRVNDNGGLVYGERIFLFGHGGSLRPGLCMER